MLVQSKIFIIFMIERECNLILKFHDKYQYSIVVAGAGVSHDTLEPLAMDCFGIVIMFEINK